MSRYYVVKPNGRGAALAPDFDSAEEAQAFADENEIQGTLTTESVYKESPSYRNSQLKGARRRAISAVWVVGGKLLEKKYGLGMGADLALELGVKPENLTSKGVKIVAYATAYLDAKTTIKQITS